MLKFLILFFDIVKNHPAIFVTNSVTQGRINPTAFVPFKINIYYLKNRFLQPNQ